MVKLSYIGRHRRGVFVVLRSKQVIAAAYGDTFEVPDEDAAKLLAERPGEFARVDDPPPPSAAEVAAESGEDPVKAKPRKKSTTTTTTTGEN